MPQVEKLLVFLASPGDVPTERRHVEEIVAELNRTVASDKGVVLQVVRWENDAFPGYGQDAQAIINEQIAEMSKYALFVGIMWNRLGTQTSRAASGTVEEFERAVQASKQNGQPDIWFYFRDSASKLDTKDQLEQRKKVLAFKEEVQANGMPWTYKNPADFRDKLRSQMILWLNARTRTMSDPTANSEKRQRTQEEDRRRGDDETERQFEEKANSARLGKPNSPEPEPPSTGMIYVVGGAMIVVILVAVIALVMRGASKDTAAHVLRDSLKNGAKGPEMVVVPAGSFLMGGALDGVVIDNVLPIHEVKLQKPFAIGRYEVTFEEYDQFAKAENRQLPNDQGWGRGRQPVINVSWLDAVAYAKWLSAQTDKQYRLPTEAEWEYAGRGGTETAYWWGKDLVRGMANCDGCGSEWDNKRTAPVGSFKPNPFGLYDTAGNVWEWVEDYYHENYNGAPVDGSAWPAKDWNQRVIRGGSWLNSPEMSSAFFRNFAVADARDGFPPGYPVDDAREKNIGFRLARDLD